MSIRAGQKNRNRLPEPNPNRYFQFTLLDPKLPYPTYLYPIGYYPNPTRVPEYTCLMSINKKQIIIIK